MHYLFVEKKELKSETNSKCFKSLKKPILHFSMSKFKICRISFVEFNTRRNYMSFFKMPE